MSKQEILDAVFNLSHSQGFYSRVYEALKDNDEALQYLEEQNFGDVVELVMFLDT